MGKLGLALMVAASSLALSACTASQGGGPDTAITPAMAAADPLLDGFRDPPQSARPRTWWHWMNGNVTQEGIARDLDWMSRIGIGGVQNFDASLTTPQIVDKRLVYMTPEWREAFRFAVSEADRHGMEFAIAASPGWSETGGPWVTPRDGMKKLSWGETVIAGGARFTGRLAPASTATGPYQDAGFQDELSMGAEGDAPALPHASGAIAVLAVPLSAPPLPAPAFSLADGTPVDGSAISDASMATAFDQPLSPDVSGRLDIAYPEAVTVRSAEIFLPGMVRPFRGSPIIPSVEAMVDGEWQKLADMPLGEVPTTAGFEPVTASRFRLIFSPLAGGTDNPLGDTAPGAESFDVFALGDISTVPLARFALSAEPRLDHAAQKAGFGTLPDYYASMSQDEQVAGPQLSQVIDLTDLVRADGTLDWTAPEGSDWRIYSFGWSLTGKTNHPATPEATGLEVDKLDADAVRRYLETYLDMYRETLGEDLMGERGLQALLTDSIEAGSTNWTPAMEAEFAARRGYDLRPWLPALAGAVIGSRAATERFLYDYRQTLAELLADKHYGTVAAVAHEYGLRVYGEALENGRPILGDDLAMRRFADVPMAALWTWGRSAVPRWSLLGDMKGASSVAHVYGQNLVAAESMTSANMPWAFAPRDLKRVMDFEFAHGVNLPVIHTSVHVPVEDRKPGLSLMIFGQHFNRNETWAEMAGPWIDYIGRSAYMLQQGRNVADIALFHGEEAPLTAQYQGGVPDGLPQAYAYDYVNAQMLSEALTIEGGKLISEGGARYSALYLGGTSSMMTLPTLRRIAELAASGLPVIGARPAESPSLGDDAGEFARLVNQVWSRDNVLEGPDIEAAMAQLGIAPDFTAEGTRAGDVMFVHRAAADADIYFINNRRNEAVTTQARFRVTGKVPELWDAITGTSRRVSYRMEEGVTVVPLDLRAEDAVFVVFREDTAAAAQTVTDATPQLLGQIEGPWQVTFQEGRGAPAGISLDRLQPLNEHASPEVRYFSGVATYTASFRLPEGAAPGDGLWVDLGQVADVAEVFVNGQAAGISWIAPDRLNIGEFVQAGENRLEVRVANRWVNRLIGDRQDGAEPVTFTAAPTYRPDAQLLPSGLIGPVTILSSN